MYDATHKNPFCLGFTDNNEVCKRIGYILDDVFVFFCRCLSDLRIEALKRYENMT